jgi:serine/threonine protein phosphatase 1
MLFNSPFVTLAANSEGRDFCIGDLHGCLAMLKRLLNHVGFDEARDRLFAVGDLIHRGPSSVECLQLTEQPWFCSVLGNHEAIQIGAYREAVNARGNLLGDLCEYSGPDDPLRPGGHDQHQMERLLGQLPLAIEFPLPDGRRIGILHAGLPSGRKWGEIRVITEAESTLFEPDGHLQRRVLWDRLPAIAASVAAQPSIGSNLQALFPPATRYEYFLATRPVEGLDLLISGHTILSPKRPLTTGGRLYLDTGAGEPDGCLTMVELRSRRYWQVGDPRTDPAMRVSECRSIAAADDSLEWLSESERRIMESVPRGAGA